jgi:diguanylate cyclase
MSSTDNRWKNKYLNLIDEHESLEKRFEDQTTQLRRAIIRLTVVAEGRDQDLDTHLSATRELLRTEQVAGLSKILEKIETGFERWQSHQETFHGQLFESLLSIETRFDVLPKDLKNQLGGLRKQVRSMDKAELLLALVNVIALWAEFMAGQPEGKASKNSWLSRLFNKESNVQEDTTNNPAYEITDSEEESEGLTNLSLEASKVLVSLISKLTLPNTEQPRAQRLLNKVKVGLDWFELVPALEILSDLVLSALGTEQEEFDAFLSNLNERLQTLQEWLNLGQNLEADFKSASGEFDEKMRGHLHELKMVLSSGAQANGNLKGSVSKQLDEVFSTLDTFKDKQSSREMAFEKHIKELSERLESMEGDLHDAKQKLNKSQLKAMTDSLTKLPNRGAYDIYIQKEYVRFCRYGGDLSMLVCDVDKFKNINDSYGHQAGDKVLQLISRQIKKGTRESDLLTRYGGEEFVVILPETSSEEAMRVAEKIRGKVAGSPFHFKGERVQVTVSCGVASFKKGYRIEQVFDAADAALYQAKEGGRNQCKLGELSGPPAEGAAEVAVIE